MSFVGVMLNKHGAVAFGDSRGSYVRYNIPEPVMNENRKKVFRGKNFLLVTWDTNEIRINKELVHLEDVIDELVLNAEDANSFLTAFREAAQLHFTIHPGDVYRFMVAYGDKSGGYWCDTVAIQRDGIFTEKRSWGPVVHYAGDLSLISPNMTLQASETWSVEEMRKCSKQFMQAIIGIHEAFLGAQSTIGGPIQVESLTWDE